MSADFRFRQFTVRQDGAAMKVGTDAVLLGAAATLDVNIHRVLDIGTGTGVIALMLAQRLSDRPEYLVTGIDIDGGAAACASENFSASPWNGHLSAANVSLADFAAENDDTFDLIVSNPPYFDESLANPDHTLALARHTGKMSYRDILEFSAKKLTPEGRLALVLPSDEEPRLLRHARYCGLFPSRILRIRTTARKTPSRIIAEFTFRRSEPEIKELILMDSNPSCPGGASRSAAYASLTEDFYL